MVSIIIPTYNYAQFIGLTLKSLLEQSYPDFECLIIDNGSTDNTKKVVEPFLQDERFRYFFQHNKGVSAGRNKGLKEARGEFIQFLDADDLIEKNKLKAGVEYLESNPEVDLVYSDMRYFLSEQPNQLFLNYRCDKNNDPSWMHYFTGKGDELIKILLGGNMMVISSPIFRRSKFQGFYFREDILHNEDWDFWLRMALGGSAMHFLDAAESKTLIRIHSKSASRDIFKMQVCGLRVLMNHQDHVSQPALRNLINSRIKDHVRAIVSSLIRIRKASSFKEALHFLADKKLYKVIFPFNAGYGLLAKTYLLFKRIVG